ncbi:MAG: bifunctional pyr operon transcriptional regulator/uracil phosphoribosyltransferase PyrR [Candidatus Hydrogenedens sp.]|nr:bifunctional pyr operon transcriptional regulator/uracil phosphoribosyltransferase PyrR [Candidatus Hydrogenedens sp.]
MRDDAADQTIVMQSEAMQVHLRRMAREIAKANPDIDSLVMLGILRRGFPIAERLSKLIEGMTGRAPEVGAIATTLYRDDISRSPASPKGYTHFDFEIDGRSVLLVDDVLAKGRTIRAAMDEVFDYGRPARIQLACLIDRGGRELPIRADFLGEKIPAGDNEWVRVRLRELDGEDMVLIERYAREEEEDAAEETA